MLADGLLMRCSDVALPWRASLGLLQMLSHAHLSSTTYWGPWGGTRFLTQASRLFQEPAMLRYSPGIKRTQTLSLLDSENSRTARFFLQVTAHGLGAARTFLTYFQKESLQRRLNRSPTTHARKISAETPSRLDAWVFDHVQTFLSQAKQNALSTSEMRSQRNLFFLHLLGLDTNGHAHRPNSMEYLDNVETVDKGIDIVSRRFEEFFGDNETAFVFTSDHGMNDCGMHGGASPDETKTLLIAWGAEVPTPYAKQEKETRGPEQKISDVSASSFAFERADVQQMDIPMLVSVFLGNDLPTSSLNDSTGLSTIDISSESCHTFAIRTGGSGSVENSTQITQVIFRSRIYR